LRWLLVFDNAEDPQALTTFLPDGPGHVVITSRNPSWSAIAKTVAVAEFTRVESIMLLRGLGPSLTEDDANRVATAIG
jgi:hypothetical protein